MKLNHRYAVLSCLLCGIAIGVSSCDALPDPLKTVRLTGSEKTVTVPLEPSSDAGLALEVDLQFTNGGENPITVLPVPEGETPYAVITYPEDFDEYGFSAEQTGHVFRLDTAQNSRFSTDDFSMTVYAPISAYELVGALELTADAGGVQTEYLSLDITGGAAVSLKNIAAEHVDVEVDGTADVVLAGTASRLEAELNGAAALESLLLAVQDAEITINGVGAAEIACSGVLDAEINGAGSIGYAGDPTVNKEINGAGTVSKHPDPQA